MSAARRAVVLKLFETCKKLLLPISTTITALITAHRYIDFISMDTFVGKNESVQVAAICFLSCKLDENTRSLRDVISVVREIYRCHAAGDISKPDLYREEMEYPVIREGVIELEQVLLRVTGFNTDIDIPHKYLLNMARTLCLSCPVVHYAYALLNDCFLDSYCLAAMRRPMALAGACLYLGVLFVTHPSTPPPSSSPPSSFATTRACLKSPNHPLHAALQGEGSTSWWRNYFSIPDEEFWRTVDFVVQANNVTPPRSLPVADLA